MTTTEPDVLPVITDEQVDLINRARDVLEQIADDATHHAWNAPSDLSGKPRAQDLGRLAGVASMASDNLFDVLNITNSYGIRDLTQAQLHNPREDEAA